MLHSSHLARCALVVLSDACGTFVLGMVSMKTNTAVRPLHTRLHPLLSTRSFPTLVADIRATLTVSTGEAEHC